MNPIIPIPTVGRHVLYVLTAQDVEAIAKHRERFGLHGNEAKEGDVVPAIVVRHWGGDEPKPETCVNLKALLDGPDMLWITSRSHDQEKAPGTFHWPQYLVPGVALVRESFNVVRKLPYCENGEMKELEYLAPNPDFRPLLPA